jgi:hypothetical protein
LRGAAAARLFIRRENTFMARTHKISIVIAACLGATAWVGCGDDDTTSAKGTSSGSAGSSKGPTVSDAGANDSGGATSGSAQTPPMGHKEVEAWLAQGDYKQWACEAKVHEARNPSPHGFNRICSNDQVASNMDAAASWPKGAAAVKELYASLTAKDPIGYAVYLKTDKESAGGANWYWYERVPLDSTAAPHDDAGVVADGMGDTGTAKSICVACHAAAGSDKDHTPSVGGRDQVYTPVK